MYSINDTIVYGKNGVCKIVAIQDMEFDKEERPYYVLKPVYENNSTLYLPVGDESIEEKMCRTLSVDEIYTLINAMPDENTIWIENENERKEQYKEILSSNNRTELVKMIKTLYLHQKNLKTKSKKLHVSDEQFFKDAEKILYNEFAHVLNIESKEVLPFIFEQLEKINSEAEI